MTANVTIRETGHADVDQVLALHSLAFPGEDLRPLVSALLAPEGVAGVLSLAAVEASPVGHEIVGHCLFTPCGTAPGRDDGALLGPLGVLARHRRQGIGGRLVRAGLERLARTGARQVFVLGGPGYYARLGFAPEREILTPCPIPGDWAAAWQSLVLDGGTPLAPGRLRVPGPWRDPGLWTA